MSNKTWVIRGHVFGYNDETYYVSGSAINSVYQDKVAAEAAYKQLEVAAARQFPLHETEAFFNGDESFFKALDNFVFERCGERILDGSGWPKCEELTDKLSDDDTFDFISQAGMNAYQLVEFDGAASFFAVWLPHKQNYYVQHDEFVASLVYGPSRDALQSQLEYLMYEFDNETLVIYGELAEISPQPVLLEQVLKVHKAAKYNAVKKELVIKGAGDAEVAALLAVNELLTAPVLEFKTLDLQEVMKIEKELQAEYGYDYDE